MITTLFLRVVGTAVSGTPPSQPLPLLISLDVEALLPCCYPYHHTVLPEVIICPVVIKDGRSVFGYGIIIVLTRCWRFILLIG